MSGESTLAHVSGLSADRIDDSVNAVARFAARGLPLLGPLDYSLSCVSLRSPVPSAFTVYTSRLRR